MKNVLALALAILAGVSVTTAAEKDVVPVAFDVNTLVANYRYTAIARPLFTTCSFRFDDITRVADFDLTEYNKAVSEELSLGLARTNADAVGLWSALFSVEHPGFEEVSRIGTTVDYDTWYATHRANDDDIYPYGAPTYSEAFVYNAYYPSARVLDMKHSLVRDEAGGTIASLYSLDDHFYFDFDVNRRLRLTDLVKESALTLVCERVRQWVETNAEDLCLLTEPQDIELSPQWRIGQGAIYFVYPRYEIACGAAGIISVPVYFWDIPGALYPKGALLLGQ